MKTTAISLRCPVCGSSGIFYSCEPKCCFNHVCSECQATFEPLTRPAGETLAGVEPPDPLPDSTAPTLGCARCESTAVYALEDGRLVCTACGTLLELEITEVTEG